MAPADRAPPVPDALLRARVGVGHASERMHVANGKYQRARAQLDMLGQLASLDSAIGAALADARAAGRDEGLEEAAGEFASGRLLQGSPLDTWSMAETIRARKAKR